MNNNEDFKITPSDLSDKFDFSRFSVRARKLLWRNRVRRPQSTAQVENTYRDSNGREYIRFNNGTIVKAKSL